MILVTARKNECGLPTSKSGCVLAKCRIESGDNRNPHAPPEPVYLASTPASAFSTSRIAFSADMLSLRAPPPALLGIFHCPNPLPPPGIGSAPSPSPNGTPPDSGAWSMTTIASVLVSLLSFERDCSISLVVRLTGNGAEGRAGESSDSAWVGKREPPKLRAPSPEPACLENEAEPEPERPCPAPVATWVREARPDMGRPVPDLGKAKAPIPPPIVPGIVGAEEVAEEGFMPLLMDMAREWKPGRPSMEGWPGWTVCSPPEVDMALDMEERWPMVRAVRV